MKSILTAIAAAVLLPAFFSGCGSGGSCGADAGCDSGASPDDAAFEMPDGADLIPFADYRINTDAGHIEICTGNDGGSACIYAVEAPFISLNAPHTGHEGGKAAGDWRGYVVLSNKDMTYSCDGGYGIETARLDLMPYYVSPADGMMVDGLSKRAAADFYYLPDQYVASARLGPWNLYIQFDHLQRLHPSFVAKMIAAGNADPASAGSGDNLIEHPFSINRGDPIGQPQVQARPVVAQAGCTSPAGYWSHPSDGEAQVPIVQLEWYLGNRGTVWYSKYAFVSPDNREKLTGAMFATANNPDLNGPGKNYYYHDHQGVISQEFFWRAELRVGPAFIDEDDHLSIFSRMGNWFETVGENDGPNEKSGYQPGSIWNDDVFVILEISRDPAVYRPELYPAPDGGFPDGGGIGNLVKFHKYGDDYDWRYGDVIWPATLDPTQGRAVIRWRQKGWTPQPATLQGMSYRLNPAKKLLKIRWSANGEPPAIPQDTDPADGINLIQLNGYRPNGPDVYQIH